MTDKWKVVAIIFIVLFILETAAIIFVIKLGIDEYDKETKCALEVCQDYDAYYYELDVCNCYTDGEALKVEVL